LKFGIARNTTFFFSTTFKTRNNDFISRNNNFVSRNKEFQNSL